ncbi:hypothetical protein I316_02111 [Kwoniella heveanensis BCC8398]|uniref:Major facilitator superfamily (MFS) profile domain-containing protein n=1 Tax=Kwoniella heveanensis BCC8398 TaxID=1296120 RepID=A0A1B9GYY3_9TREE|nr:hypothetical protein I316_02111 [Kwoniella heveanensis BCC8398]
MHIYTAHVNLFPTVHHSRQYSEHFNMVADKIHDEVDVKIVENELGTESGPYLDPKAEAKLTRKLDIFIIPILGVLYLLSFLDRGNIGNANIATPSLSKSLGLNAQQYSACVSVVYATYVVFEPVWANLLKILTPKVVLAGSAVCWGGITLGTAWAHNYHGLLAIRILLGAFEAGLFPCISVYIFMNYRREEVGRRMSYIFACSAASGAFGGLIAYGLIHIETGSLVGWQYLYVVEGILSLAVAPLTYFYLPNDMSTAWFLNAEQKEHARIRTEMNKAHYDPGEQFSWRQVRRGFTDWKTYATGTIQFCADVTLYGLTTFMPAIIKGMGYSNVHAQLLTVPVYFVGALSFLIIARFSDHYKLRSPFILLCFVFLIIGYGVLAGVKDAHGRYAGVFICALGLYGIPGLNVTWISGNTAGHYKRTTSFGLNQLMGNSAGAAIGTIYLSTLAPYYYRSLYISIGLSGLGAIVTVATALALRIINRKRETLVMNGAADQPELGDANPHFK